MTQEMDNRLKRAAQAAIAAGAREVYVFGSWAHGKERENSDVDMAVAGLPPERFYGLVGEMMSILGRLLDLVDLDEDSPFTRYLREKGELKIVAEAA